MKLKSSQSWGQLAHFTKFGKSYKPPKFGDFTKEHQAQKHVTNKLLARNMISKMPICNMVFYVLKHVKDFHAKKHVWNMSRKNYMFWNMQN
jgi:hypothetical protein